MKTYSRQPEPKSDIAQPKASKQASAHDVLQAYKSKIAQRQEINEDELLQGKFNDTVQREEFDEDELLQGRFETAQREEIDEDELLQEKFDATSTIQREEATQPPTENRTGMPDNLKSGIESLSGYSMDDVRVHYNSSKPAQLQALAYAQGTDIHIASGQEQHLPHEAWHVVQQMQGRVQPTTQLQGVNVNDNEGLEKEADVMGGKAVQMKLNNKNLKVIRSYQNNRSMQKRKPTDLSIKVGDFNLTHGTSVDEFLIDKTDASRGKKTIPDAPAWLAEENKNGEAFSVHAALVMQGYSRMKNGDIKELTVHIYDLKSELNLAGWNNWYQVSHFILKKESKDFSGETPQNLPDWDVKESEQKAATYAKNNDKDITWNTKEAANRLETQIAGKDGYHLDRDLVRKESEDILFNVGLNKLKIREKRVFNVTCSISTSLDIRTTILTASGSPNSYELKIEYNTTHKTTRRIFVKK